MRSGLFAFILLSAFVHAVVIGIEDDWIFNIDDSHEQGSSASINIELFAKPETNIKPTAKLKTNSDKNTSVVLKSTSPKKKIEKQIAINVKTDFHAATATEKIALISAPETTNIQTKEKTTNIVRPSNTKKLNKQKTDNNEKIKALLNNELSKHFYYPKAAQRKNRQGAVTLAFTISRLGEIENIHINKSSGFKILDKAAIKALKKIDANEELAKALNGDRTEHTLPVIYKLTRY